MTFKILILICVVQLGLKKNLTNYFLKPSHSLHSLCLKVADKNLFYKTEIKALICGQKISQPKVKNLLSHIGVLHMFVVSGAHIQFYRRVIALFFPTRWLFTIQSLFLALYSTVCLFSAPLVRASVDYLFEHAVCVHKLNWGKEQRIFISGICCLIVNPYYFQGLSLGLSWVAALCLCQKSQTTKVFLLFIALYPLLLYFYVPHPLSAVSGFFLASITSFVLLPINVLCFLVPFFNPVLKFFYDAFYFLATHINDSLPKYNTESNNLPVIFIWVYVLLLNLILIFHQKKKPQCH